MKRMDLERMLADPNACGKLLERAKTLPQRGEGNGPKTRFRSAPFGKRELPGEILAKNNNDAFTQKSVRGNMSSFMPELAKETPLGALKLLSEKCKTTPSRANQRILADAINRVIGGSARDSETEKLVEGAIKILATPARDAQGGQLSDSIWSRVYRHSDFDGRSYLVNHEPGWVYWRVRKSSLDGANLNDRISSLYVDASATEVGGRAVLFQHDRFNGRFRIFTTTAGNPDERAYYSYVGEYMNDRTSSILMVRQYENEINVTIRGEDLQEDVEDQISAVPDVSLRGDARLTWDMWPGFDPDRRFLYLKIPITVEIDNWWDYDAEIRYWIYLYVDGSGNLGGYVDWYGAWVEGGILTDSVLDGLMDAIPDTIAAVNDVITDRLSLAALFAPYERQYFLPGDGAGTGHTDDGVTVVLVRS